ncbi:FAD-dependent oxidoreductase [soil metagenome]
MSEPMTQREVDVVVVGSGAAGLMAAVVAADAGLSVEVLEKATLVGGTSAWSGGMPWMPLNEHEVAAGIDDSRNDVLAYLDSLAEGREPDRDLVRVFVDNAGAALAFLETVTAVTMSTLSAYPDYYADRPGSRLRGRSVEPEPLEARRLLGEEWYGRVRESPLMPRVTREEMTSGVDIVALSDERRTAGIRTMGSALISGLLRAALDRGVTVTTDTPAVGLLSESEGVTGVTAGTAGTVMIHARRGVVLACGGFEWNSELVRSFLGVAEIFPLTPGENTGDGLLMGIAAGASLANMTNAVTRPCAWDGSSMLDGKPLPFMATPRQDAGCIIVNRHGRRFVNEGVSYMDMGKAFRAYDPQTASYPDAGPVWMIFDSEVRDRTSVGDFVPHGPTPSWVAESDSIAGLASAIEIDPETLVQEVARYNRFVVAGVDDDFGRGTVWFEGLSQGGPSAAKNLASIERGPYFAMRLYPGVFGTIGGLRTDARARVTGLDGAPIAGLYAVGNVSAGVLGQTYPGGGSSLGPNLTFAYLAGRDLATSR